MGENEEQESHFDKDWQSKIKNFEADFNKLSGPIGMANIFAQTMANAKNAGIQTRIPVVAEEWAEVVFNEWFELIGKVARSYGLKKKLSDRDLFDPREIDGLGWREGITLEEVDVLPRDDFDAMYELGPDGQDELLKESFGPFGDDPKMASFPLTGMNMEYQTNLLSGQYNRLFPMKIVLRTAASLILTRGEYNISDGDGEDEIEFDALHIEDLREESLKVAKYAKEQLKWFDKRRSTSFGEKIAIGFPDWKGEKSKKQSERFVSQFVGTVRTPGKGLPFEIGFLSIEEDGMVSFTEAGVEFMLEKNPLIDLAEGWKEMKSFTDKEKQLILMSIRRNVPKEFDYMMKLIKWISEGVNRPTDIEEQIISDYEADKTTASLMRTGALARMIELDLVSRKKDGRKVTFSLTELGQKLAKS